MSKKSSGEQEFFNISRENFGKSVYVVVVGFGDGCGWFVMSPAVVWKTGENTPCELRILYIKSDDGKMDRLVDR